MKSSDTSASEDHAFVRYLSALPNPLYVFEHDSSLTVLCPMHSFPRLIVEIACFRLKHGRDFQPDHKESNDDNLPSKY